jgi:hypothetical protein
MRVLGGLALVLLWSACGPKTMDARLRDAERLADRASNHLDRAEKAAAALEPKDMESALADAKSLLAEKDIELYPEAQMHLDRYQELAGRLPQVKAAREKRDLDLRLNAARDKIVPRVQAMLEAQEALLPSAPTRALVDAAENKAKAVKEAVDEELDLFVKDADFAAWAKSQRNKVDKALESVSRARKGVAFLEGPVTAWKDGLALQKDARDKKELSDKEAALRESRTRLSACDRTAKPFDEDKITASLSFAMPSGKPQTPEQLSVTCQKDLKDVETEWKKVLAALDAEKAKLKAKAEKEAKEKAARDAKEAREKAAREAKDAKERAIREAKEAKDAKDKAAKDAKEKAARDAKEAKDAKDKAAKDAKEKAARDAKEARDAKDKAAKEAKEKAARDAKDAKDAKDKAAKEAKEKAAAKK